MFLKKYNKGNYLFFFLYTSTYFVNLSIDNYLLEHGPSPAHGCTILWEKMFAVKQILWPPTFSITDILTVWLLVHLH